MCACGWKKGRERPRSEEQASRANSEQAELLDAAWKRGVFGTGTHAVRLLRLGRLACSAWLGLIGMNGSTRYLCSVSGHRSSSSVNKQQQQKQKQQQQQHMTSVCVRVCDVQAPKDIHRQPHFPIIRPIEPPVYPSNQPVHHHNPTYPGQHDGRPNNDDPTRGDGITTAPPNVPAPPPRRAGPPPHGHRRRRCRRRGQHGGPAAALRAVRTRRLGHRQQRYRQR